MDDIYVTRPHLPPLEELLPSLRKIWERRVLTNGGPLHQELEAALARHLDVEHVVLFNNATIALMAALRALDIRGEVITTPFSFVATSHALLWNGLTPVFVDIDPATLNLDPAKVEAAITPRTTALLPVHCYGHPCDVDALEAIARRRGLRVLYDAAHAFGVRCHCGSVLRHGDLSVLSFHATKVFNTFEGGAVICPDAGMRRKVEQLKNFGHEGEANVVATGLNGKMSEFNAAVGLAQLGHMADAIARRRAIDARYRGLLGDVPGLRCLETAGEATANYAYFPILVGEGYPLTRDELLVRMKAERVHPRRYFHPLISEFPMYRGLPSAAPGLLPVATRAAREVLCLPIYPDLTMEQVDRIAELILRPLRPA
jgi:dTDP-4-amino-4,6-dideoxygalactose transaminase